VENEYHTAAEAFIDICERLLVAEVVQPRGHVTTELLDVTLHIEDPMSIPFDVDGRDLNMAYAGLEILQLLGQTPADGLARRRAKNIAAFQDAGISYGNYGARMRGQLTNIVKELRDDGDSRRAVATIYDGTRDLGQRTRDIPCTLTIQCFIRDAALHSRVSMRSNDAWLGLPYDLTQFCALHCALAEVLAVAPGRYTHTVGSMHLYERDWEKIEELGDAISNPQMRLFSLDSLDCYYRLQQLTERCQDILDNTLEPDTRFETWLLAVVHNDD
jgi:thymidylate synthase